MSFLFLKASISKPMALVSLPNIADSIIYIYILPQQKILVKPIANVKKEPLRRFFFVIKRF